MDKKEEIKKWLVSLKEYAKEEHLPLRIIDGIEECEEELQKENPDWNSLTKDVDQLMKSIGKKAEPAVEFSENGQVVTVSQIKDEIKKMTAQCKSQNQESMGSILERRKVTIQKSVNQMKDMEKTEANYDKLVDTKRYTSFFEKVENDYNKELFCVCKELLTSMAGNYDRMMKNIQAMFQSLGSAATGIGNEAFYHMHDEQKNQVEDRVLKELESEDTGGIEINEFGRRTGDKIKQIIKKNRKRKAFLNILPILILLIFIIIKSFVSYENNVQKIQEIQEQNQIEEDTSEMNEAFLSFVKDHGEDIFNTAKDLLGSGEKVSQAAKAVEKLSKVASSILSYFLLLALSLGIFIFAIFFVLIVLYITYIHAMKKQCKKRICRQSEEYISKEMYDFEKENHLFDGQENIMIKATEELERQYSQVLESLFGNTIYDSKEESSKFENLKSEWEAIR